jgi:hypothetical protein
MVPWHTWPDRSQLANGENERRIHFIQWTITMITGAHIVIFSTDPEIDRAFLRNVRLRRRRQSDQRDRLRCKRVTLCPVLSGATAVRISWPVSIDSAMLPQEVDQLVL